MNPIFFQIDDDDVARKISEKLKLAGAQGISFCNIAKKAQELGRRNLAIKVMRFYFQEKFHQVSINYNHFYACFPIAFGNGNKM